MSPKEPSSKVRNRLLKMMSAADKALLQPNLEPVPLERHKSLEAANKKIENVYFPDAGIISVVASSPKSTREVEIGIIGCEGVSGVPVILGTDRSPHQTFVQVAGSGHRLPAAALRAAMEKSATLQPLLLKYAQAFMIQAAHTAIANGRGTIEERLARWLLMAQDRIERDELPLTHEFLAMMLAVRRPGVTEALHALTQRGLMRHERGIITIVDREGLVECANGLYGVPEAEYNRLLGGGGGPDHGQSR
jgi:CRP-like cAMP-binding protein